MSQVPPPKKRKLHWLTTQLYLHACKCILTGHQYLALLRLRRMLTWKGPSVMALRLPRRVVQGTGWANTSGQSRMSLWMSSALPQAAPYGPTMNKGSGRPPASMGMWRPKPYRTVSMLVSTSSLLIISCTKRPPNTLLAFACIKQNLLISCAAAPRFD